MFEFRCSLLTTGSLCHKHAPTCLQPRASTFSQLKFTDWACDKTKWVIKLITIINQGRTSFENHSSPQTFHTTRLNTHESCLLIDFTLNLRQSAHFPFLYTDPMPYNCISEIICTRQHRYDGKHYQQQQPLTWSFQYQYIKWADSSILDWGTKFLLNLLHNKLSWLCTLHSTTTHFDDGAPIWLLILIWTMSGESELTPTPELYRYNGEDVVWTWRLGKASASFWELSSLHMRKYNSEDPLVNTLF